MPVSSEWGQTSGPAGGAAVQRIGGTDEAAGAMAKARMGGQNSRS